MNSLDIRNKNNFYLPVVSLSFVQKRVSYFGVKILIAFQAVHSHKSDKKRFKNKLYRYLIIHSFYSITVFLECKIDEDNILSTKLLL